MKDRGTIRGGLSELNPEFQDKDIDGAHIIISAVNAFHAKVGLWTSRFRKGTHFPEPAETGRECEKSSC